VLARVAAALGLVVLLELAGAGSAIAAVCGELEHQTTGCATGSIGHGGVDLTGSKTRPGNHGGPVLTNPGGAVGVDAPGGAGAGAGDPTVVDRDAFGATGPLTIVDIRHFHPKAGVAHMEPNGWAVIGLDTNFYSIVAQQVVHGRLLHKPAEVRFTPVAWHWSYGDGHSAVLGTGGGTWASQRIEQFDPTPTSHVYTRKGTYAIALSIDFAAEYRLGAGAWVPVTGVVNLPTNPLQITAGDATTVLVGRDCRQNPSGPGC
jgi:hypothetical protein